MNPSFVSLAFGVSLLTAACASHRPLAVQAAPRAAQRAPAASQLGAPRATAYDTAGEEGDKPAASLHVGAAVLVERALNGLRDDQPAYAMAAFRAALATGDLNESGRALVYWYIYAAEELQGHRRASRDALADFVAAAQSLLAARATERFAEAGGSDFVERFDLHGRLARGRALLNLAWAKDHARFGRSALQPVPVQSAAEVDYFVELAPACTRPLERRVTERHLVRGGPLAVQQVNFRCQPDEAWSTYFFEWHGEQPPSTAAAMP